MEPKLNMSLQWIVKSHFAFYSNLSLFAIIAVTFIYIHQGLTLMLNPFLYFSCSKERNLWMDNLAKWLYNKDKFNIIPIIFNNTIERDWVGSSKQMWISSSFNLKSLHTALNIVTIWQLELITFWWKTTKIDIFLCNNNVHWLIVHNKTSDV